MNKLKIDIDLFEMSDEEIGTSKMMYDGKVIKCLVAPYHTFADIEEALPYSENTFVYPEREMSINQIKGLISMIVSNPNIQDARIITSNQNIIIDMVDACVRVLTEGGDILASPCKTMMANIHDIRYYLLENEAHQLSKSEQEQGRDMVNKLITECKEFEGKSMSEDDFKTLHDKVQLVGEDMIKNILNRHLDLIKVTPSANTTSNRKNSMKSISDEIEALTKNMDNITPEEFDKEYERLSEKMTLLTK